MISHIKKALLPLFILPAFLCQAQDNRIPALPPALEIQVHHVPKPVVTGGHPVLFYEIHLTNFSPWPLLLTKVEAQDAKNTTALTLIKDTSLLQRLAAPGQKSPTATIPPGNVAVLFVEYSAAAAQFPAEIIHQVSFKNTLRDTATEYTITGAAIQLVTSPAIVLGAPLKGGPWTAVYSPVWAQGHRRVIFVKDGVARIPGRFAVDFVKLDSTGKFAGGDDDRITNWYGYGAGILAVADGVVSSTRTDFPESTALSNHPDYAAHLATGNYISLKIAENTYVFYEHLQPESIVVKAGQRVKKGDVIARLGFTGQSTGPHLHLHVANADAPLGAEGLPFVFEKFTLTGTIPDFNKFGSAPYIPQSQPVRRELPVSNSVITFP
ncbi:M23 family metallopeptidase [Chitinophaga sp. ARDCPP14]|uniref:M23 family metallopeptidase n=1 Tax=Chitinophaga sp. ARDCPP14 TaxID=3391139 RepID=UPI003F51EEED